MALTHKSDEHSIKDSCQKNFKQNCFRGYSKEMLLDQVAPLSVINS